MEKSQSKTTWSLLNSSDGKIHTQLLNKAVNYPLISLVCYYPWHEISLTKDALKKLKLIRAETIRAFLCHTEWKHWWSTQQIFSKWKWQFDKFFRCHKEVYQVKYILFIVCETEIWVAIYLLAYYMWSNGFLISKNLEWDVIRWCKRNCGNCTCLTGFLTFCVFMSACFYIYAIFDILLGFIRQRQIFYRVHKFQSISLW